MIRIQVRPNEPLETALRRFKRQCNYAGIFRLAKKAAVYEKPSEKRRREARERVRNVQRAQRKMMQVKRARRKLMRRTFAGSQGAPAQTDDEGSPSQQLASAVVSASTQTRQDGES